MLLTPDWAPFVGPAHRGWTAGGRCTMMVRVYRYIEHESEIEILIEDDTPEAVLTEALVALGDVLSETRGGEPVTHEMSISAHDLPALLAAWINDLIYLAENDGFIPERVIAIELDDSRLEAVVGGERAVPASEIRLATYRDLELEQADGAWWARVVLAT